MSFKKDRAGSGLTIMQEDHYYPFGMKMAGLSHVTGSPETKYTYSGKELEDDFNLNWYHYGARYYDPQLGRWQQVDPADEFHSPYVCVGNNPVNKIDPDGNETYTTTGYFKAIDNVLSYYETFLSEESVDMRANLKYEMNSFKVSGISSKSKVTGILLNMSVDAKILADRAIEHSIGINAYEAKRNLGNAQYINRTRATLELGAYDIVSPAADWDPRSGLPDLLSLFIQRLQGDLLSIIRGQVDDEFVNDVNTEDIE